MHVYKIGRSAVCDIVLRHASVSRQHAELLVLQDGCLYLTDCASKNGTYLMKDARRHALRQLYVQPTDHVCFGDEQIAVSDLLSVLHIAGDAKQHDNDNNAGDDNNQGGVHHKDLLLSGPVQRNPVTGELIRN